MKFGNSGLQTYHTQKQTYTYSKTFRQSLESPSFKPDITKTKESSVIKRTKNEKERKEKILNTFGFHKWIYSLWYIRLL